MQVKVLLFGPAAAAVGCNALAVSVGEAATCGEVLAALGRAHEGLAPLVAEGRGVGGSGGARLAVNHEFVESGHRIKPSDEVALIAMVSGG